MYGSTFEASNDKNFKHADTLFQITEIPFRLFNTQLIDNNNKYRYIRYCGGNESYCGISEIQIFGDTDFEILKGSPFGSIGVNNHSQDNAFDENPYTSFYTSNPSGDWIGLDLGEPRKISKIIYTPRNRDNNIRVNDTYELLYLKKNIWNSLGRQTATSDSLVFNNVPSNSLLYLKNHTRGNQERIFIYKDDIQVFL